MDIELQQRISIIAPALSTISISCSLSESSVNWLFVCIFALSETAICSNVSENDETCTVRSSLNSFEKCTVVSHKNFGADKKIVVAGDWVVWKQALDTLLIFSLLDPLPVVFVRPVTLFPWGTILYRWWIMHWNIRCLQEAYGTHGPTLSNLASSPSVFPSTSSEYNDGPLSASNHLDSIPTSIVNRTAGLKPKDLGTLLLGLGLEKYLSKFNFNPHT